MRFEPSALAALMWRRLTYLQQSEAMQKCAVRGHSQVRLPPPPEATTAMTAQRNMNASNMHVCV